MATDRPSPDLERAFELLDAAEPGEAEALLLRAVERQSAQTAGRAFAEFELATVLVAIGELPRAIAAMKAAADFRPQAGEEEATRDRLTYLMNLGEMLEHAGELDEAAAVLERGLEEREELYGDEHPGVAYGLEPLAAVELARGDLVSARNKAERAVSILWNAGHPRVTAAIALRAEICVALGSAEDVLADARNLPDEMFDEVIAHILRRAESTSTPRVFALLLSRILPEVEAHSGDSSSTPNYVLAALMHAARDAGDHRLAEESERKLAGRMEHR